MLSHIIKSTMVNGKRAIIKYWDLYQIRNNMDAMQVQVGDVILYEEISFKVTYLGKSKRDGHRAWTGKIYGAEERWSLSDNTIITWGPAGIANTFYQYDDGNFFEFCLGKNSYLWLGN